MPHFDIYEANVSMDGVNLPEYNVSTNDETKTVTCWIPSEVGKRFSVNWKPSEPRLHTTAGEIIVDGIDIGTDILEENQCSKTSASDVLTSLTTVRPFMFSSLEVTDDNEALDARGVSALGNIQLSIWKVDEMDERGDLSPPQDVKSEIFHERSKNCMAQQVKFGNEESIDKIEWSNELDFIERLVTFIFKYRSIETLRAEGAAPPVPETCPTKEKRKFDDISRPDRRGSIKSATDSDEENNLDSEEEEREENRVKELREEIKLIEAKLAKKASKSSSRKRAKTEPRSSLISGEVIDLTGF